MAISARSVFDDMGGLHPRCGMLPTNQGSMRLFRFAGVNVWLHWSWLIIMVWALNQRQGLYSTPWWNLAEYLGLFGIVLLHEFGHALACRQVGGQANQIVLWPLGGVAYVHAPPRPGAQLWSIAAGPMVNVGLIPVFYLLPHFFLVMGVAPQSADFWFWLATLQRINIVLLIFNLLPVYPLDGGQIVRSLLWFGVGPRKSLLWASAIGLAGAASLLYLAWKWGSLWLVILVAFLAFNSWRAFQSVRTGV